MLGIIERDGELRAGVMPDLKTDGVKRVIEANIEKGAPIMTDEHAAYARLGEDGYWHHAVRHGAGEYVRHRTIHIDGIESVWALLKRQIVGIHHWVSPKHQQKYVDEMTWRSTAGTCSRPPV